MEQDEKGSATSLVDVLSSSKLYDLSQPLYEEMPIHEADPPFLCTMYRKHASTAKYFEDGFAYALELIVTSMHCGTHMDAPVHMSKNGRIFGDVPVSDIQDQNGEFRSLGIDQYCPRLEPSVLLDIAESKGVCILEPSYEITRSDLEAAAKAIGVKVKPHTSVIIRTGYGALFSKDKMRYRNSHPGIGKDAGAWLAEKNISIVGIDNLSLDATPTRRYDAHVETLIKGGIYIIKNLYLEELSANGVQQFSLAAFPLKLLGGTGSLLRPIAVYKA